MGTPAEPAARPGPGELAPYFLFAILLAACQPPALPPPPAPELPLGTPVTPAPREGLPGSWSIPLQPGEAFQATVGQLGVDVVVDVLRSDGELLLTVDRNIGRFGPERVCFVAEDEASVVLRIRPYSEEEATSPRGSPYRLTLEHRGPAREVDRECAEALRAFMTVVQRTPADDPAALLERAEVVRRQWEALGFPFEQAVVGAEMASLAGEMEDLPAALRYREEALGALDSVAPGEPGSAEALGVASLRALLLNGLGLAYQRQGRPEEAERCYSQALEIYQGLGDLTAQATLLNNRARVHSAQGAVHEAMEIYRRVAEIARREGDRTLEGVAQLNLGLALSSLGEFLSAQDALSDALELFREIGDRAREATTSNAIGWVHTLEGRQRTALEWYEKALRLSEAEGSLGGELEARDRMGTALRRLGRLDESRRSYHRALELTRALELPVDEAHVLANLGWLEVEAGRPQVALEALQEARERFERLGHPDPWSYTLIGLASAYRQLDRLDEALAWMERAGELVEEERALARSRGHRLLGVPLWPDYQELLVDLLMELDAERPGEGYDRRAFEVADLARARHLSETLLDTLAGLRDEAPAELLARERELNEEIRRLRGTGDEAALRASLAELEEIRAEIRRASPRLAELHDPEAVTVDELQELLEPGTVLASYFLGGERSFVFVVSRESFTTAELGERAEIDRLARAVYEALRAKRGASTQLALTAPALTEAILEPIAALLDELETERLLVAADGMLHYLPFAALPWPDGSETLLLERLELVSVPSATVAATLRQARRGSWKLPESVAVLADPDYPPGGLLRRLPYSRQEAEAIEQILGPLLGSEAVRLFLGPEARPDLVTGDAVEEGLLAQTGLLHFASHALIDEQQPELSRVALTGGDLSLHEIYSLELAADLVVLSGCSTALGEAVRGEGLVGLTRGFFHAGVPRVVVSLWPVDDLATALLMERFYQALAEGLPPAAALARAQGEMRRTPGREAPVHWAGFVLQGDWR